MIKKLWEASLNLKLNSNLYSYERYISQKYNKEFNKRYINILNWSLKNPNYFWSSIWDFCKVKGKKSNKKNKKSNIFYKNVFLPKSKLNFGENLLSKNDDDIAITFISENGFREERNWKDININVSKKVLNFLFFKSSRFSLISFFTSLLFKSFCIFSVLKITIIKYLSFFSKNKTGFRSVCKKISFISSSGKEIIFL